MIYAIIGFGLLLAICIFVMVREFVKEIKSRRRMYERLDDPIKKAPVTKTKAVATKKYTDVIYSGSVKYPKHKVGFFVIFSLDSGENKTFKVDEMTYKKIKENAKGTLIDSNGEFIDFK